MIGAWWWVQWDGYSEMVTMRWVQSVSWTKQWLRRGEICLGRPAPGCCTEEYPSSTEQLLRVYLSAFHLEGLDCQLKVQASGNQILHGRVASCSSILACCSCCCLSSIWLPARHSLWNLLLLLVGNPSHATPAPISSRFTHCRHFVPAFSAICSRYPPVWFV